MNRWWTALTVMEFPLMICSLKVNE